MSQPDKGPKILFLGIFGHAQSIGNSLKRKKFGDFEYFPCKKTGKFGTLVFEQMLKSSYKKRFCTKNLLSVFLIFL
jgi:hypothetical protein